MEKLQKIREAIAHYFPITEEDKMLFEPFFEIKQFKKKSIFLNSGSVCRNMTFVEKGVFRMFYVSKDKEINTRFFMENSFMVDFPSFLNQEPSKYTIEALEDSEVILFDYEVLNNAFRNSHKWEHFGRIMAEKAYQAIIKRVENFQLMDGEQRYLEALKNEPQIFSRIPLYHIASYLGLERESLSRLRKKISQKPVLTF